ncbi:MAG TPA: hypothetical protein VE377_06730 [Candidatus Dormibacteraeota bacterium]|nr:hypothetical protein [Candidatus Dormibacteraeota bacterium]
MEFTIEGHNSLLGDLARLDSWLASMGVPARSSDRIHRLIQVLAELNPRSIGAAVKITREERRLYMYALAELVEFHQIFTWLNKEDPSVLGPKLIRALSGSIDPLEESVSNSVGRNTMFELSLASEWRRAGLEAAIGEPDLKLILGQQEFLVECKRPFDWSGVVRCLKDANRQLKKDGARTKPGAPKGVIAISLSRVIAGGEQIFLADSMADKSKLQEIIERELAANRWRWWTRIRFDQSIGAVLFHLSLPADVGHGDHFALLSFSNVYQAGANPEALALLNQAMEPLYSDATPGLMKVHPPGS